MSLGTYLRTNKLNSTIPTKIIKPKDSDLNDKIVNGGGDSIKKVILPIEVLRSK